MSIGVPYGHHNPKFSNCSVIKLTKNEHEYLETILVCRKCSCKGNSCFSGKRNTISITNYRCQCSN